MNNVHIGVGVIVLDECIVGFRRNGGKYKGYYELPGGKVECNEHSKDTVIRELKEELDIVVQVDEFIETVEYDYDDFRVVMDVYYVSIVEGSIKLIVHDEMNYFNKDTYEDVLWLEATKVIVDKLIKEL